MNRDKIAKRILKYIVPVKDNEIAAMLLSALYFFLLFTGYYPLRALRENMGVKAGIENLAWLWTGTLIAIIVLNPIFSAIVARYPRRIFIAYVYRFFIINLLIFFVLFKVYPDGQSNIYIGRAFYMWLSVFNLFVVSVGWGFMADIFNSPQGKRLFGFIASGASLGGLIGSALIILLVDHIDPYLFMIFAAILLEAVVRTVKPLNRIATRTPQDTGHEKEQSNNEGLSSLASSDEPIHGSMWEGILRVSKSPYLIGIALLMVFWSASGTIMYLAQADIADNFADDSPRIKFFASVNFWVNVFSFFGQAWLASRLIKLLGVGLTLAILPVVIFVGFTILGTSITRLEPATLIWVFIVIETIRKVANYSLAKPAREILYTVVPRAVKYKSKIFIDTFIVRSSDPINGWIIKALGLSTAAVMFAVLPIAGVWFMLALALGKKQKVLAEKQSSPEERLCTTCGFDLSNENHVKCPECGAQIRARL